ncbi:hypothetical protein PGB90_008734 [Kerria lacca]
MSSCTIPVPKSSFEQRIKRQSIHGITERSSKIKPHQEINRLLLDEKHFLLAVERGDLVSVNRILTLNGREDTLNRPPHQQIINYNCIDPLGRSAVLIAIDNENYEMLKLLINNNVDTTDALLHAVSKEFVEAVELLINYEENKRKLGEIHSWERKPQNSTVFTVDVTPLILAAHKDNYEIIKILLDKGACLTIPHDNRCNCEECVNLFSKDSLLYSYSRINAYRALSSPCFIVLSSEDPILTAFELSSVLRKLSKTEHEFKSDYRELTVKCQKFASDLLNHIRSSNELGILLNYSVDQNLFKSYTKSILLSRLKKAIKLEQKEFVTHPNVQQLLASVWYAGLPGFRGKNTILQTIEVFKIGVLFPIFSVIYILAPYSSFGKKMRTPFIKFICHSASYFLFLFLIIIFTMIPDSDMDKSSLMYMIFVFIIALIWNEIKSLWNDGLKEYISDMWHILDFITTALYLSDMGIHVFFKFTEKGRRCVYDARGVYDDFHPKLLSEALFSTANIFSTLKLVYIFSINPYLGPLQIVLARVIIDIAKFFLVYVLVLLAFSNGLYYLLSPYSKLQETACQNNINNNITQICNEKAYVKFLNLFETAQVLFWTAFGEIHLNYFSLKDIRKTTELWGLLMYGSFCVISMVVLLNLLIAMMDHSYNKIFEHADVEWKFARSKLWMSFFEEGRTVPPPFNIIPSPKSLWYLIRWLYWKPCLKTEEDEGRSKSIQNIMKNLVQRYIMSRQNKICERGNVTEDDINEIKQELLKFKNDLIHILQESGMKTKPLNEFVPGKKNRFKERRLINGLTTELSESASDSQELPEAEFEKSLTKESKQEIKRTFTEIPQPILHGTPKSIFKKEKIRNIFSRGITRQSWESAEEIDNNLTSDSDQITINVKKVWTTGREMPLTMKMCLDQAYNQNRNILYMDDFSKHNDINKF